MIDALFVHRDAEAIRRLRPPLGEEDDQKIWGLSRSGEYSMKSAYRQLMAMNEAVTKLQVEGEWSKLWKIDVPPKMRHFLWRSVRDVLPTRNKLWRRRIEVHDSCGMCSRESESLEHLFLDCEVARGCWRVAGLEGMLPGEDRRDGGWEGWLTQVLRSGTKEIQAAVAAVAWGLWRERNDRVWNQVSSAEERIVRSAQETAECWRRVQGGAARNVSSREECCQRWHKPPTTFVKIPSSPPSSFGSVLSRLSAAVTIRRGGKKRCNSKVEEDEEVEARSGRGDVRVDPNCVSWLCSLIGKPVKKFIREGLDVKVCIIRDKACVCPETLSLEMENEEIVNIGVSQMKAREYNVRHKKVWRVTQDNRKAVPIEQKTISTDHIIVDKDGVVRQSPQPEGDVSTPVDNDVTTCRKLSHPNLKIVLRDHRKHFQPPAARKDDAVPMPIDRGQNIPENAIISFHPDMPKEAM
ncbi:Putative ribonuclease H protein At1g65750 [Linum perenne]